jgi:anhydro-N-acetylmuramic acid kinase
MSGNRDLWGELGKIASKEERTIIGLMSGTSVDGVTACALKVAGYYTKTAFTFLGSETYAYAKDLRGLIFELFDPQTSSVDKICSMNFRLGEEFAKAVTSLAKSLSITLDEIDLIGSHGQTIYHDPRPRHVGGSGSTLQIGELAVIAEMTGLTTIGDFRKRDLAVGGEGAPLSPYVDFILFRDERKGISVQNIGGIANLTYLPPGCTEGDVIAFDSGPGNMIVDRLAATYSAGELSYDPDGSLAARGNVDKGLLEQLVADPFFSRPPPKSTGREAFGTEYSDRFIREADRRGLGGEDAIATATMLTVETISRAYEEFVLKKGPLDTIYLAGGGAKNRAMADWLRIRLPGIRFERFDSLGVPAEAREAAYMAILANEFVMGHASNLPSATGARRGVILGALVPMW